MLSNGVKLKICRQLPKCECSGLRLPVDMFVYRSICFVTNYATGTSASFFVLIAIDNDSLHIVHLVLLFNNADYITSLTTLVKVVNHFQLIYFNLKHQHVYN